MFTCGVKLHYSVIQSQQAPALLKSCLGRHPRHTPNLSDIREPFGCWLWTWRWSPTSELSGMPFPHYGLSCPGCKSLFLLISGLQALRDKRFDSKLASKALLLWRRDLGIIKIIHEHIVTEAVREEKGGASLSAFICPFHHRSQQGMSHAILRSSLWPKRRSQTATAGR